MTMDASLLTEGNERALELNPVSQVINELAQASAFTSVDEEFDFVIADAVQSNLLLDEDLFDAVM